jgi:two-component system cell cycle response regulator DivK
MMARILVVEDNEMNMDMVTRRLSKRGYDVLAALDGQKGVDVARTQSPDLILMDMSLPVMDGWTATKILKEDEQTKSIPIIALTAHAIEGERERCLAAGADDYEPKPIKFALLIDKIKHFLGEED